MADETANKNLAFRYVSLTPLSGALREYDKKNEKNFKDDVLWKSFHENSPLKKFRTMYCP